MPAEDKKNIVKMAYIYFQEGRWDNAIEEYQKLIALDSEDWNARSMLGDVYVKKGDFRQAYEAYSAVLKEMQARGQIDKVKILQRKILALKPETLPPEAQKRRRILELISESEKAMEEGRFEDAQRALDEVVQLDPESIQAAVQLGELLQQQGKKTEAARQFLQVAQSFMKNRLLRRAQEFFQKVEALDPGNIEARQQLAQIFVKQGSESDAKKEFLAIAERCIEEENWTDAETFAKKAIEFKSIEAHYLLGLVYFQRKKLSEARSEFEELLRFKVNHVGALTHLALCYLNQDKNDKAQEYFQRAQKVGKDHPLVKEVEAQLAWRKGQKDQALRIFDETVQKLMASKDWNTARAILERFEELSNRHWGVLKAKAEFLLEKDQPQEAEEIFAQAARAVWEEKPKEAETLWEKVLEINPKNADALAALKREQPQEPMAEEEKKPEPIFSISAKVVDLEEEEKEKKTEPASPPKPPEAPPSAAPADPEADLKAQIQIAEGYVAQGLVEEAIELYQQLLELHPDHSEVKKKLNEAYSLYVKGGEEVLNALESERRTKEEEAKRLREEIEKRVQEEEARKAKEEEERRRREEEEAKRRKAELEQRLKEEAAKQAEKKLREEMERKIREELEAKLKAEAERKAKEEAERKAKEEAERKAKEEALKKQLEEAEAKAREAARLKAQREAELREKDEKLLKKHETLEKKQSVSAGDSTAAKDEFMTVAVADIYARQGLHEEALRIYRKILEIEPDNFEAKKKLADLEKLLKIGAGAEEKKAPAPPPPPAAGPPDAKGEKETDKKKKPGKVSYL